MQENPFEQTTLSTNSPFGSTPASSGNGIEVRYLPALRILVPAALAVSGVVLPIILLFTLPAPMNGLMAALTAMVEFSIAAFVYFLFNSAFVRVDDAGVTKSQMGKAQSVRWEEIVGFEFLEVAGSPQTKYTLRDASGKTILEFNDFGNKKDGARMLEFIELRLENRK